MAVGGMQYYSNATLWTRLSQLLYASDEVSKGLYAEAMPLGTILGGIVVAFSKKIGHQRWQVFFAVALQTSCVGAMSTATIDNAPKSIILTIIISMTSSLIILNGMVLVGFGIVYQEDMYVSTHRASVKLLTYLNLQWNSSWTRGNIPPSRRGCRNSHLQHRHKQQIHRSTPNASPR